MSDQSTPQAAPTNTAEVTPQQDTSTAPETQEVSAEGEGEVTPEQAAAAQKQIEKQLKKLKIKYNGKEEEVAFDPDDTDFLTKQFQMAKLGQSKAQEAALLQKQVAAFVEELRKNPRKVLQDPNLGVDFKKIVNEFIEEEIANSQKSPEQLAKEQLEQQLKELQERTKKQEEEFKQREFQRMQEAAVQNYDMQMTQALEKSDLPKSPYVVKKMVDYMMLGVQNGIDVAPDDIIPLVREEIHNDIKEMFAVLPEDVVEQIIGKDVIGKIRKKSVAKAKTVVIPKAPDVAKSTTAAASKKISYKDFFKI